MSDQLPSRSEGKTLSIECWCGDTLTVERTEKGQALWERFDQEHEMCDPEWDEASADMIDRTKLANEPVNWIGEA